MERKTLPTGRRQPRQYSLSDAHREVCGPDMLDPLGQVRGGPWHPPLYGPINEAPETMKFEAITEESIRLLVDTFYEGVRKDDVLGPVFENALHGAWDAHMPRMYAFWSTVLLGTSRFQGNVYGKHMALPGIGQEHFVRWLSLFKETVTRLYDDQPAREILEVADRIAGSLQLGFFGERTVRL